MTEPLTAEELYLDLLKKCLTRYLFGALSQMVQEQPFDYERLRARTLQVEEGHRRVRVEPSVPEARIDGRDWPADAETMIGLKRLDNIQYCIMDVLRRGVPGDLIETGVWRGGAAIFMRGVLKAYGDTTRRVWAADSFEGLPRPDPEQYAADANDPHWAMAWLAVSLDEVKANFARYGLLDDQVRFLVGWFRDTLPTAPIERLAVVRLDGDMYESTIQALDALYPKLSVGGYLIVDDYGAIPSCRQAIDDFRAAHGIDEEIRSIDWTGVFWQRRR